MQCCVHLFTNKYCGLHTRQTPVLLPFPDLTEPATAFSLYVQQGIDPARIIRVENVYLQARTTPLCLSGLHESTAEALILSQKWQARMQVAPPAPCPPCLQPLRLHHSCKRKINMVSSQRLDLNRMCAPLQNLDMAELVERVRAAVVARAAQLLRKEPDAPVDYLVVDLPCTFFMLRTLRCLWV